MPENEIEVSAIVCARDAEKHLPRCLRALLDQSLRASHAVEIVVLDGGSRDRTFEAALEFKRAEPALFTVLRQDTIDLSLARGKYVFFCGARDLPAPGLLGELHAACEENGAAYIGGNLWTPGLRGLLARRDFLLANGLPVKTGTRAEQLAAYDTLRPLVSPEDLPQFCADWAAALRGVCLEECRESADSADFYRRMISLAGEPQVVEALARAECRGKFLSRFKARDWIGLEKMMRASPSLPSGRCGICSSRPRPWHRPAGRRQRLCRGIPRRG